MSDASAVRVLVSGRVQGVFFRQTTRSIAHDLGLQGWVRNRAEGDVEILAIGTEPNLRAFLRYCKEGPPMAAVDDVTVEWIDVGEAGVLSEAFEIR